MPRIAVENQGSIEIYYEEEGSGEPVLLVGGLTSTVETWGLQRPALAAAHRVILADNRGSGRTRVPEDDGDRRPERLAGDVRALLDGLDLERVHLVGASMGGMIAQAFALTHPGRLRSLTLACTTCGGPRAVPARPEVLQRLLAAGDGDEEASLEVLVHPDSPERRREALDFYLATKRAWPHPPEEIRRRALALAGFDVGDRVAEVRAPTLVLTGRQDVLIPPENARRLAAAIPGAELVEIDHAGHIFFCEQAEATNRALLDFLGRHEEASGSVAAAR